MEAWNVNSGNPVRADASATPPPPNAMRNN